MLKGSLVEAVDGLLEKNDYVTFRYAGCFDLAARREKTLFLKVLQNVDSFSEAQAMSLKIISNNINATAFLVGLHTRREKLAKGVVYERFDIPTVSLETLREIVEFDVFPKFQRDRGGFYVEIDSAALKKLRVQAGFTQRELAEAVGISKKAIYEHEKEQLRMDLSIAEKLEKLLEGKITREFSPSSFSVGKTSPVSRIEKEVASALSRKGFAVDFVSSAPFDIFAKEKTVIVSDVEKIGGGKRTLNLERFIAVVKKPAFVVSEKNTEEHAEIPVIARKELGNITKEEIIRIAKRAKVLK